jgi:predicted RNA methylase
MDETFSSVECITECLSDVVRTEGLVKAIESTVKEGDIVLDSGTGSAILALVAARAGAKKVIALEFDPYVAQLAQQNIDKSGYHDVVEIRLGDARTMTFEDGLVFDVVIMEMLTTGMVDEHQVWTINNLHEKNHVDSRTIFVPKKQDTYIQLTEKNFVEFGFEMKMLRHIWSWLPDPRPEPLAEKLLLNSISFKERNDINFSTTLSTTIAKSGVLNSVLLTSETFWTDDLHVGDTLALNAPVVIPLEEDIRVEAGDDVTIDVTYTFGGGYRNFKTSIRKS